MTAPDLNATDAAIRAADEGPDVAQWLRAPAPPFTAIDSHAHVFVRGLPLAPQRRHTPDYDAPLGSYVRLLAANGISHAVLVQPSFLGTDNSFLTAICRQYPQRFRGVAVVDPAVSELELASLADSGVVGIRLNLLGLPLPDLRSGAWRLLLARVNSLQWHVEVQCATSDLSSVVDELLAQRCKVVIDHFGRPTEQAGAVDPGFRYLLSTAVTGRVWVKLSAAYRSTSGNSGLGLGTQLASSLLEAFGAERLVWGSDWPHTQHQDVIDYAAAARALASWVPDESTRATILIQSARELFRFDERSDHS